MDEPASGIFRDTAVDMAYDCGGIDRLLCVNVAKAYSAAASAPDVDQILVLANSTRYGGTGYPSQNVDTFEGAYYSRFGIYRPTTNSKMRALDRPFQEVNNEQFVLSMYETVSPVDEAAPPGAAPRSACTLFSVTPVALVDDALDVQWSIDRRIRRPAISRQRSPRPIGTRSRGLCPCIAGFLLSAGGRPGIQKGPRLS